MLKLYGLTKSRALRCIWMLYEIDAPFELVRLSPEAPDFPVGSDINPNRKIPALVDGTTVMWESHGHQSVPRADAHHRTFAARSDRTRATR
jgi:glutathione S-transferase